MSETGKPPEGATDRTIIEEDGLPASQVDARSPRPSGPLPRTVIDEALPGATDGGVDKPSGPLPRTVIDERGPAALLERGEPGREGGPDPRTEIDDDIESAVSRVANAQKTDEVLRRSLARRAKGRGDVATPPAGPDPRTVIDEREPSAVAPIAPTMLKEGPDPRTMIDEAGPTAEASGVGLPRVPRPGTITWLPADERERAADEARARPASEPPAPAPVTSEDDEDSEGLGAGDRILQYELIRSLGRGGMGQVFLARDTRLGRKVAIKLLNKVSERFTERFLIEARATARCDHDNIVVIHEVNEHEGQPFMVLEYLEGEALSRMLTGAPLPAARAVELIVPVVRALVRAHEFNIVHRDLKPDNIIVRTNGTIKVLDFGIAKLYTVSELDSAPTPRPEDLDALKDVGLTREGALLGTMLYMSPEQWGAGTVDQRTDLWAVGLILYEMVAGRHPLAGLTPQELMSTAAVLHKPIPSVGEAVPDLPGDLERIIDRCLAKRKEERFQTAQALLEALEPLLPRRYGRKLAEDESPYPGLSAFQESDAGRFFGRTAEIVRAGTRLRDQPLVGVVGPSGVGKSSFVRAGVVPALKSSGEDWETFIVRPGRNPMLALASMIQPLTRSGGSGDVSGQMEEHAVLVDRLRDEPGYLGSLLRKRARQKRGSILLFVDQFEELYTLVADAEERKHYTACLAGVADDAAAPLRVVISMRSDFLDRVAEDQRFVEELTRGLIFLQAPDREGLREAITAPLELVGYRFESDVLVDDMLEALESTPGALPLLQFSAAKLWESRDRGARVLTERSFRAMGGIAGALATHADEVFGGLSSAFQKTAKAVLTQLVTPDGTRAIVDVAELRQDAGKPEEVQRVVDYLVRSRLLVVQSRSDAEGPAVEIVHESLINRWPMLRRWLDEGHEDAVFLEQLRSASKQWDAKGRDPGLLWRGEAFEEADRWYRRYQGELPALQQQYLDEAFDLANRAARRRRALVIGTIAFLVVLVAVAVVTIFYVRGAEQKARTQATLARKAEKQVKEKLLVIKREQAERARAEAAAKTEKQAREKTQIKLDLSYKDLQKALRKALAEQKRAKSEERKAQAEKKKAEVATEKAREANRETRQALAKARKAAEAERKARAQLQKMVRAQQAQLRRLRLERKKITTGLK